MLNKEYINKLHIAEYVSLEGKTLLKPLYGYDESWVVNGEKSFFPRRLLVMYNNRFIEIKRTLDICKVTNRVYYLYVPV